MTQRNGHFCSLQLADMSHLGLEAVYDPEERVRLVPARLVHGELVRHRPPQVSIGGSGSGVQVHSGCPGSDSQWSYRNKRSSLQTP